MNMVCQLRVIWVCVYQSHHLFSLPSANIASYHIKVNRTTELCCYHSVCLSA